MSIDILGVTGHRPEKLGGFSDTAQHRVYLYARDFIRDLSPNLVITGMAQGWDIAVARACINLGTPFLAYVPFAGQECKWPAAVQDDYRDILTYADEVKIISKGGYAVQKMFIRNLAIVDDSDELLAMWNGDRTGGTWNTVESAMEINQTIHQAWDGWKDYKKNLTALGL